MNYYISDMHLFHKKCDKGKAIILITDPFNSLAEMHEYMKEKWNSKITNGDTVYILGDIAMQGYKRGADSLSCTVKGQEKFLLKEIMMMFLI